MTNNEDTAIVSQTMTYIGPLPTSSEFAGYDKALPGAADRILSLAEQEASHRHKVQDETVKLNKKGQLFAFIIALLSMGLIFASFFFDQPLGAIAPAIVALTSLASVLVGKKTK
jgi:uncharacterized membrane protein